MSSRHLVCPPSVPDSAGDVPVRATEWGRAGAGARGLYLHVTHGAGQRQRGLGLWDFAGHRAVWPAAWKLCQSGRWVRHLDLPWVRTVLYKSYKNECNEWQCEMWGCWLSVLWMVNTVITKRGVNGSVINLWWNVINVGFMSEDETFAATVAHKALS